MRSTPTPITMGTEEMFTAAAVPMVQFLIPEERITAAPIVKLLVPEEMLTVAPIGIISLGFVVPENNPANNMALYATWHKTADLVFGSLAVFLVIVGILGNLSSLLYFWPKRHKTIHPFLYAIVSSLDICTSVISLPVVISLFNSRAPGLLFETGVICTCWPVVFYLLVRVSMWFVMLVSVTRTIAMTLPFRTINKQALLLGTLLYTVLILSVDVVYLLAGLLRVEYREQETLCELRPSEESESRVSWGVYSVSLQTEFLLPSVIIFTSFIVSLVSLQKMRCVQRNMNERKFQQVTVTVVLFTAVFLLCNLPAFVLQVVYFISLINRAAVKQLRSEPYFRWYAHLLSHFFLTLLNAALNPCLYLLRMPGYRTWSLQRSRRMISPGDTVTSRDSREQARSREQV